MIKIKNAQLLTPGFTQAFVSLLRIKKLDAKVKLDLIKLRGTLERTQTNLLELRKDGDLDEAGMREVLESYEGYHFKPIPVKLVIEELSALEVATLSPIVDMED